MKNSVFFLILLLAVFSGLPAQENQTPPEPYEEEEFPDWALSLRRGEIILIGSYPITFLATSLVYGLVRFGINSFEPTYAPQPFAGAGAVPLSQDEIAGIAVGAASVSLIIAVIDYFIFRKETEKKRLPESSP
ncbi:MAG: hypothetical protein E4H36_09350 [Spirochaetales bacterium]|nr:MAG: hypothetical protein E4H36_09350 [Spirochaetales bacterium]